MARPFHIPVVLTALLSAVVGSRLFAGEPLSAVPVAEGLEAELLADATDGEWNRFRLIEAALVAEGLQSTTEIRSLSDKFGAWTVELRRRVKEASGADRRAVTVLELLHQRVFTGQYVAECNELSRTIRRGDFNCITATIAYLELGRSIGLPLTAIQAPGHVRVRLAGDVAIDIEPTCPTWQRLAVQLMTAVPAFGAATAEPDGAGGTRRLTDIALVGKVYYNRGIRSLEERRFPQSLAATRAALALDPNDEAARNNLLAAYNNWALACCEQRRYQDASALILFAREIGPGFPPLAPNDLHIHQKWVLELCQERRFDEAPEILEQGRLRYPEADLFDAGRGTVRRWQAESEGTIHASTVEMD